MTQAIDFAQPATDTQIAAMKAAGIPAIIRYLWSGGKGATAAEMASCAKHQMPVVFVYEAQGDRVSSFTPDQAAKDAANGLRLAELLGAPQGASLYWCADDFDATDAQIANSIVPYFQTLAPLVRAQGYRMGAYGNGAAMVALLGAKLIDLAWVWGAMGTNGTRDFIASGRWAIRQHVDVNEFGLNVDPDDVQGDFGAFIPGGATVAPSPAAPAQPVAPFVWPDLKAMQTAAGVDADGLWGPKTAAAVALHYQALQM